MHAFSTHLVQQLNHRVHVDPEFHGMENGYTSPTRDYIFPPLQLAEVEGEEERSASTYD